MPAKPVLCRVTLLILLLGGGLAHAGGIPITVAANSFTAWTINGVENPPLTLLRGQTYQFQLQNVITAHPFFINTINTTGGGSQYNVGVTNNGATGNTVVTFTVPTGAPNSLHYNCGNHAEMNGPITILTDTIFANGFEDQTPGQ